MRGAWCVVRGAEADVAQVCATTERRGVPVPLSHNHTSHTSSRPIQQPFRSAVQRSNLGCLFLPACLFFLGSLQQIFAMDHVFEPAGEVI